MTTSNETNEAAQATVTLSGFRVPGLPNHVKLVKFGNPQPQQFVLNCLGKIDLGYNYSSNIMPIVEPDNVYGAFQLENVTIPEGYERAGNSQNEWFRRPEVGEYHIPQPLNQHSVKKLFDEKNLLGPDTRRIVVRRKTKRVLVRHNEYDIAEAGERHIAGVNITPERADEILRYQTSGWSIEERPVT